MAASHLNVIIVVLLSVSSIQAQNGIPCHTDIFQFTPRHSLNIPVYMGKWYMQEISGSDIGNFPAPDFKCAKRTLSLPDPEDILTISAVDSYVNIADGVQTALDGDIKVRLPRSPFSSVWNLTREGDDGEPLSTQVMIMWADLEFREWTVQYSCSIRGPDDYRYEVLMAMTRTPEITPQLRSFLKALMVGQGFRLGDMHPIDQTNCENY